MSLFWLRRVSAALAFTLFAALMPGPVAAQTTLPRAEIEKIVKEYLLANPEVLRDALIELDRRGKVAEEEQRSKAVQALAPKLFRSPHQVVLGNPQGKIDLVEFFDYNCGYCKRSVEDLAQIMKKNPDVRVILKEFPVLGPGSVEAAQVAHALRMQVTGDKYWAFHTKLLGSRGQVGRAQALAVAKETGADMTRLQKDMESDSIKVALQEVMSMADALSLTGTPSYVLGTDVVVGAVGAEQLQGRIDSLRKCGQTDCK